MYYTRTLLRVVQHVVVSLKYGVSELEDSYERVHSKGRDCGFPSA
jgi:hypothetical protein